jgi:6-phosphogluconate dehydrogenase
MQAGIITLGRMGVDIARPQVGHGGRAIAYDREHHAVVALTRHGAASAAGPIELVRRAASVRSRAASRACGKITQDAICRADAARTGRCRNCRRATRPGKITSAGLRHLSSRLHAFGVPSAPYCLMISSQQEIIDRLGPTFMALAPGTGNAPALSERDGRHLRIECGYIHAGSSGARQFVKMAHNGMSIMQSYAEVFDIRKNAGSEALRFNLDIADIAEVWRRGGFIPSWLLDLAAPALANGPSLDACSGFVEDSREGRWTEQFDETVAIDPLAAALFARLLSRRFAEKTLSGMRKGFSRPKALQP